MTLTDIIQAHRSIMEAISDILVLSACQELVHATYDDDTHSFECVVETVTQNGTEVDEFSLSASHVETYMGI
ncbi:hypothetical protein VPHF86_0197 [Vibrio phage F86]